jgi:predicted Ser/Thr protein kinase
VAEARRELELLALERLGLAGRGSLAAHQVAAVRAYMARNEVVCRCGRVSLAPDGGASFACPGCGAALVRGTLGDGPTPVKSPAGPPQALGIGSRVGPLELRDVLGRGASGTVYKAWHTGFQRLSAVKVLPRAAGDEKKRKRFEREVEALGRIDHAGIVRVHATFEVGTALACEMELVEGTTLEGLVRHGGPLPWRDAAALVARIADAVAHAHAAGVIHRDLKPLNVLVRREDGAPLVADFGLARLSDQTSSLTRAGALLGTPRYMAPEAFDGATAESCDVYGLGAILYFTLTGRGPFDGVNDEALVYAVTRGAVKPTETPSALESVRARAMAPDPKQRYASAAEVARDLRLVLAGEAPSKAWGLRPLAVISVLALALAGLALALGGGKVEIRPEVPRTPVQRAIDTLGGGASGAAAAEAQRTLAGPQGLAGLDAAVAKAPDDRALRALRAATRRRVGVALDVEDLDAAPPEDLDALASHALRHGLRGKEPVVRLRELQAKNPTLREVATLLGEVACATGDSAYRADAVRAFAAGRPSDSDEGQQKLARVLSEADVFAGVFKRAVKPTELVSAETSLARDLGLLAAERPAVVPLVLAPVGSAARAALADRVLSDPTRLELPRALLRVLAVAREALPPGLAALYSTLRDFDTAPAVPPLEPAALAGAGLALADTDPLLAATSLELAAASLIEPDHVEDVETIRSWYAVALRALDEVPRRAPTEFEEYWQLVMVRRCAKTRALLEERLAARAPDAGSARLHVAEALRLAREGLAATLRQGGNPSERTFEALRVIRLSFRLGRVGELEDVLSLVPQADAFRAEARRLAGDAAGALTLARTAATAAPCADSFAALALAAADAGEGDTARDALTKLVSAEASQPATLDAFHAARVRDHVTRKTESGPPR